MKLPAHVFTLLLLLGACFNSPAANLRIVTTDYAPYNTDHVGNQDGYSTRIVRALLAEAGLDAEIEFLPWARTYNTALTQPNVLIFSLARNKEREPKFNWIGKLLPMDTYLYKASDRHDIQIKTLADTKHLLIGGINQGAPTQWLESQSLKLFKASENSATNLNMLLKGRVDLLVFDPASLSVELKQANVALDKVVPVLYLPEPSYDLYLAMSKPSDPKLLTRVRQGFRRIVENGQYAKITSPFFVKYGGLMMAKN